MKFFLKILRVVICLGLIYFVVSKVDYEPLRAILRDLRIEFCIAIIGVLYVQNFIKALKWHTLLQAKNINLSLLRILQVDFSSTFLSLFVPSTISLDLFRAYGLSKEVASKKQTASSIIVDRLLSLFALIVVANISVLLFYKTIAVPEVAYTSISTLIVFTAVVLIINSRFVVRFLSRYKATIRKYNILHKLEELRGSVNEYKLHRSKLIKVFFLSVAMQTLRIVVYYLASLAVNANIPFQYFMIFTPIVMFLVMLPISLAGIGLRESSFVYFFSKVGVLGTIAFAIPALVSLMVVISVLPGGLILAVKGLALKKQPVPAEESSVTT
ncbi:flippase-like domain-containing protein [candidate division KSB1 bacterium]|nr:flippase-like domain-containing protein [candidate division KSB1 bacterium]TDI92946.1 MAG: flippase-like domain-containing protein [Caldithrix sp.]